MSVTQEAHKWLVATAVGLAVASLLPRNALGQVTPDEFKRKVAAEMKAFRDEGEFRASDAIAAEYEATLNTYIDRSPYLATERQQEYFLSSLRPYFERLSHAAPRPDEEVPPGQDVYDKCYTWWRHILMQDLNRFGVGGVPSSEDIDKIGRQIARIGEAFSEAIRDHFADVEPDRARNEAAVLVSELEFRTACGLVAAWSRPLSDEELKTTVMAMDTSLQQVFEKDGVKKEFDSGEAFDAAWDRCFEVGRNPGVPWTSSIFSRAELTDGRDDAIKARTAAMNEYSKRRTEYWKYREVRDLAKEGRGRIDLLVAASAFEDPVGEPNVSTESALEQKVETAAAPEPPATSPPSENANGDWARNAVLLAVAVVGLGFAVVRMQMARRRKG
jgi:hypothetical protein